ncbi:MAG: phytanoyl-CoA dioxygenase family protein [Candidatus Latescibacterota bacterium]|nr:phytanoyl-CoA dioxygenase family protein [Candidatus Latescibacterota bacterium]
MNWEDDTARLKSDFDCHGYVVIEGFMDSREAGEVAAAIDRHITEVLPSLSESAAFYEVKDRPETIMRLQNLGDHDEFFRELYLSDRFVGLAELLLDDGVVPKNMQWFNKPPRVADQTPPHQDGFYFMLEPNEALTMWLALDSVDEENGCIRYLPGAHRRQMRPHQRTEVLGFSQGIVDYGDADFEAEVAICAEPGDLIVHHCMIVHRADANLSARNRAALGLVYFARRARVDEERAEAYRKELWTQWEQEGRL